MAELDDISGILNALLGSSGSGSTEDSGGTEGGIDPEVLLKILDIVSKLEESDKYTDLLKTLRPLLREENRRKLDRAAMILKLMNILPLLGGSGIMDGLS